MIRPHPSSTLFPSTTLSRSAPAAARSVLSSLLHQTSNLGRELPVGVVSRGGRVSRRHRSNDVPPPLGCRRLVLPPALRRLDRKSTRLNSSHANISYAVFCLN